MHRAGVTHEQKATSGHRVVAGEQKWDGEPSHPPSGSAITRSTGNASQDPALMLLDQCKQVNPGLIWTAADRGLGWDCLWRELLSPLLPRPSLSCEVQQIIPLPRGQTQEQQHPSEEQGTWPERCRLKAALSSRADICETLFNSPQLPREDPAGDTDAERCV